MRIVTHLPALSVLLLAALAGCPVTGPQPSDAAVTDATPGMGGQGGTAGAGEAMGGKPIAAGCAADSECASGFCVDSVCCDSACDDQCETCNVAGTVGYCTAQIVGDDTTSAETCTGAHTCSIAIPVLNLPACRLKTLQACKSNSDCASLLCETFYVDHDGDGYGESQTTLQLCEVDGATPPAGYVTQGGDCCDSDANAFPGQSKYFVSADSCGSYDYNCDGTIQGSQSGFITYGTVPVSECGTNVHGTGCGDSCTATIECH